MTKPYDMLKHLNGTRGSQPQQPIQVNINDAVKQSCSTCGCPVFLPGVFLYKLSALLSPTSQELTINQPTFICANCYKPFDQQVEGKND